MADEDSNNWKKRAVNSGRLWADVTFRLHTQGKIPLPDSFKGTKQMVMEDFPNEIKSISDDMEIDIDILIDVIYDAACDRWNELILLEQKFTMIASKDVN